MLLWPWCRLAAVAWEPLHGVGVKIKKKKKKKLIVFNLKNFIGVELINNIVLVSNAQQSESYIYIHYLSDYFPI